DLRPPLPVGQPPFCEGPHRGHYRDGLNRGLPMSVAFAVFTSDPNLLACELQRLAEQVALVNGDRQNAVGVGHYGSDEVLLQRYRFDGPPREVWKLMPQPESEALVYHA